MKCDFTKLTTSPSTVMATGQNVTVSCDTCDSPKHFKFGGDTVSITTDRFRALLDKLDHN